ncbi:unnamed protein product [Colias eurytheme]|nr:unnamed protein product [Colias eurytheme]
MANDIPLSNLNIKEFNSTTCKWNTYVSQLEAWFDIHNLNAASRTKYLIAVVGAETLDLIIDLCYPKKPEDLNFDEIVKKVRNHLIPKKCEIAERMSFRACKQEAGQSLNDFMARLKQMARNCNFEGTKYLEENLRDQFVYGIRSDTIRFRLLTEETLTYARATEIALSLEAADRDSRAAAEPQGQAEAVHAVYGSRRRGPAEERAAAARGGAPGGGGRPRGSSAGAGSRRQRSTAAGPTCWRCAGQHAPHLCSFSKVSCYVCGQRGHIAKVCKKRKCERVNHLGSDESSVGEEFTDNCETVGIYTMDICGEQYDNSPWYVKLSINGVLIDMQVDSGAGVSVIPILLYKKYFSHMSITPTSVNLKMYNGHSVKPMGKIKCDILYKNKSAYDLDLIIVDSDATSALLGRQWMKALNIKCININSLEPNKSHDDIDAVQLMRHDDICSQLMRKYPNVFKSGIGTYNGPEVELKLKSDARPIFCKARLIPYSLRDAVDKELARLQQEGIISPVDTSEWGTPIVPVIKSNGDIRLCGDFKITLNPVLLDDKYPIPRIEDIFCELQGGKLFSKIDLSHAYQQLKLSDESKLMCCIVTHRGIFCYNRLPFGIKTAVSIFQRFIDKLIKLKFVTTFIDDILITGVDDADHMKRLMRVFDILSQAGLRVAPNKCKFFQRSVSYLGHVIDAHGLRTETVKIDVIKSTPVPCNVSQLKAFLGLVNYYAKFLPNLSTVLYPLHNLLKKNVKFIWCTNCNNSFKEIKRMLSDDLVLVHYNPNLPLRLYCDASPYGVGAALMQRDANNAPDSERPVAHASRTLTASERNYAQICREGLAVIFAVHKFHCYLYGRQFTLITDCKPLANIFYQEKSIPRMVAGRLQRWAVILAEYNYRIECVRSDKNCVADALSRLPSKQLDAAVCNNESFEFLNFVESSLSITYRDIAQSTKKDIILSKVLIFLRQNWEFCLDDKFKLYWKVRDALSIEQECIMFGLRVVIPSDLRERVLSALHSTHQGIVRMKSFARSYVWWPGLDKDLERICNDCRTCAMVRPAPARAATHPWEWPQIAWYRVHVDFLSPKLNVYYFILIDAYSKWIEAFLVKCTSADVTINCLRGIFARFGYPYELVSDNGPPFSSKQFAEYLGVVHVKHILVSPYKPSSNGAAENSVKLIKNCLKKAELDGVDCDEALQNFLLMYRNTKHCTTGRSPSELLLKKNVRTAFDSLRPDLNEMIRQKQRKQIISNRPTREFSLGDKVLFRKYRNNKSFWVEGVILDRLGPLSYKVGEGKMAHKRHIDQLRVYKNYSGSVEHSSQEDDECETASKIVTTFPTEGGLMSSRPDTYSVLNDRPVRARRAPVRYGFE